MTKNEVITALRKEVKENPAASAVFHVFALRKRARHSVTITSLAQKMKNEGFEFTKAQYVHILKFLANLGLGTLVTNSRGHVRALHDIKTTLQSIGVAACGQGEDLDKFNPRRKFMKLTQKPTPEIKAVAAPAKEMRKRSFGLAVSVKLPINGKMISLEIPKDLTTEEITGVLDRLQDRKMA